MALTSVDFPAPFSPSKAWICSGQMSISIESLARKLPYRLVNPTVRSSGVWPECRPVGVGSDIRCHVHEEWVPQYWASLDLRVSREKAPALAQLFGRRPGLRFSCYLLASLALRSPYATSPTKIGGIVCCKIVTVDTNRNNRFNPASNVGSFAAWCTSPAGASLGIQWQCGSCAA